MNLLRKRMENHEKLCGTLVNMKDSSISEIFGVLGYDFIWIDGEHSYMSLSDVLGHLQAARARGMASIVRVPQDDLTQTKKILEMGPDGIIFPMIHSAMEAKRLLETTLYPPEGTRGFGPMRAIDYGATDAIEYAKTGSRELCRFIQIEHIDCIEALEEIVKIDAIDGYIFGPNDLSGSIGKMGQVFDADVTALMERAIKILRANGKYVGICGGFTPDTIAYWSKFGVEFLAVGGDWNFLYEQGKRTLADLHQIHLTSKESEVTV